MLYTSPSGHFGVPLSYMTPTRLAAHGTVYVVLKKRRDGSEVDCKLVVAAARASGRRAEAVAGIFAERSFACHREAQIWIPIQNGQGSLCFRTKLRPTAHSVHLSRSHFFGPGSAFGAPPPPLLAGADRIRFRRSPWLAAISLLIALVTSVTTALTS